MNAREFQKKAKEVFLKENPGSSSIGWLKAPRFVTYPTGVKGWEWEFDAKAPGFRSRTMLAQGDETYIMIR